MKPATRNSKLETRSAQGYTLIELLVATAIISLVTGLLVMILYQFFIIPSQGNAQLAVDSDLRNAGLWLMRDGNESQVFTGTMPCNTFTFDTGQGVTYIYARNGNALERTDSSTGQTTGAARHVSDVQCPAGVSTSTVGITIFSSSGDVSASQTYTITLRVD